MEEGGLEDTGPEVVDELLGSICSLRRDVERLFEMSPQMVKQNREKLNEIGYILRCASEDFKMLYHRSFRKVRRPKTSF